MNVVTKSGTNEYHGSLFEYLRNNAPDAKPFFSQSKTPFQRNQFGGAIGGPIRRNKLFFFADYQGTYFNTAGAGFTTVPTDKMYKGDFSELLDASQRDAAGNPFGQIYDPFTRKFDSTGNVTFAQPFPGNIIPTNRFDPVSAGMNADAISGARESSRVPTTTSTTPPRCVEALIRPMGASTTTYPRKTAFSSAIPA